MAPAIGTTESSSPAKVVANTKVPTRVFASGNDAARHVAMMVEGLMRERASVGQPVVLGLPTGSTPVGVYRELIRLHREEHLDFSNCITFNLDEYYPMQPDELQSYHRWMHENFFDHVNVPASQIHIPDGSIDTAQIERHCDEYEEQIRRAGGLDLVLLGVGRTGHVGFNEPGSARDSRTKLVTLDRVTRRDAASDFFGEENVPQHAITMGVGTILSARKIVMIALGEHKAPIVQKALEGPVTDSIAASFLQEHPGAVFILDEAAAAQLTVSTTPWLVGPVKWSDRLIRKAVLWLSFETKCSLLKLTDDDFREHHLHELLREHGPAEQLCHRVFDQMLDTLCPHPAGQQRRSVLVFSPHPDDDVISMGGTILQLVADGHEVHIAYMTSGNIAVFDHDALRYAEFVADYNAIFELERERAMQLEQQVQEFLRTKKAGQLDSPAVQRIKALIRRSEAKAAAEACGIPESQLHFLDLPFYQTGTVAKLPIGDEDVRIVRELLEALSPAQVYVAGDLSDPHGTHRMCADAIFAALADLRKATPKPEVWLYRGAWQEWGPHEIERAVPMSPSDLQRKKVAIFMHESQKDSALFPGPWDNREFWQRAVDRNRNTANLYDQLGLPEYYALEGFVQWKGEGAA